MNDIIHYAVLSNLNVSRGRVRPIQKVDRVILRCQKEIRA